MADKDFKAYIRSFFEGISPQSFLIDIFLVITIVLNIIAIILEEIESVALVYGGILLSIEWFFTILFTIEYLLRAISAISPKKYIFSRDGIIDMVSFLPLYFSGLSHSLQLIRILRLIRISSRILLFYGRLNKFSNAAFGMQSRLSKDEKISLFFKPSRKKIIWKYALIIFLIFFSIAEIFLKVVPESYLSSTPIIMSLSLILLIYALFMLVSFEYRIWSERYAITNQRLIHSSGIFHEVFQSKSYRYITNISLHQNLYDKVFNIGDIEIRSAGGMEDVITLKSVSDPLKVKKMLSGSI